MANRIREMRMESAMYMRVMWYTVRNFWPGKRGKRFQPTSEVQKKCNERNRMRYLSDLLHLNFTPEDVAFHPTYEERWLPETFEDALKHRRNFVKRLKRAWAKATGRGEKECKIFMVTAQSSTGRVHHHMIMSGGLSFAQITKIWGMGHCDPRQLEFDENGITGLSHYIAKENERKTKRSWATTKNFIKPEYDKRDGVVTNKDAAYTDLHPDDVGFIEEKYPGWGVAEIIPTSRTEGEGEDKEHPFGHFIEIRLYRKDNRYFRRDKNGYIHYGYPEREEA